MAGLVESFCLQNLPQTEVDFLLARVVEYQIPVTDDKKGDKAHLLKVVMRHLTSADVENSADGGAAIFLKLYNDLGGALKDLAKQDNDDDSVTTLSYRKLRQFKINGTVGDPGQKNCLSYSSLVYQINLGETQGYTIHEIYAGVIRAIEAGNPFRELLELEADDFDKESFLKTLKSHFQERDPNSVFNELRTAVQGTKETAHRFCCRCVALKKKVLNMAASENTAFDEENLNATFYRTIYTGLKQTEIRNELRQILKEGRLDDAELLSEVSQAQSHEEERMKKMGEGNERRVNVNKLTCESDSDESESQFSDSSSSFSSSSSQNKKAAQASGKKQQNNAKGAQKGGKKGQKNGQKSQKSPEDAWNAELSKMTAAFEKLSSANAQLTAEVNVLKGAIASGAGSHNPKPQMSPTLNNHATSAGVRPNLNPSATSFSPYVRFSPTNRPIHLCKSCHANKSNFCRHCFKCGADSHKIGECPEN